MGLVPEIKIDWSDTWVYTFLRKYLGCF